MRDLLEQRAIHCPYCGEQVEVLLDCSVPEQDYVEDCQVCCRPIEFHVRVDGEQVDLRVGRDDE